MDDEQFENLAKWADENAVPVPQPVPPAPAEPAPAVPLPDTPAAWFSAKFPNLEKKYGPAVEEVYPEKEGSGLPYVKDVSEDFLCATLGEDGTPSAPTVFVAPEARFYSYVPAEGIFVEAREAKLTAGLSELLLECARGCGKFDTRTLQFKFRDSANLRGVLARARGVLEVVKGFFETGLEKFVPCKNGMLEVATKKLLPFGPEYR